MKRILTIITAALTLLGCTDSKPEVPAPSKDAKVLVAYFSYSGNTRNVAEMVAERTKGTLFQIESVTPYPEDYDECVNLAGKEAQAKARPAIKADCPAEDYDVIFLGYPNWWSYAPMPVYTWVEKHNLKGKTIIPFCTHEGSGLGDTADDLAESAPGATFGEGFALRGTKAKNNAAGTKEAVDEWLSKLGF